MISQQTTTYVERAYELLEIHDKRELYLSNNAIFADPAWELLLEIFIATEEGCCVARSGLRNKFDRPASTTSRWIAILKDKDYIEDCDEHGMEFGEHIKMVREAEGRFKKYLDGVAGKLGDAPMMFSGGK